MNYDGLRGLLRRSVNLWPRPQLMPEGRTAFMRWQVMKVDAKARIVEIQAPSGHTCNVADVIHHFQEHGEILVLDAQMIIDDKGLHLEPRPWGATAKSLRRHPRRVRLARRVRARVSSEAPAPQPPTPESPWGPLFLFGFGVAVGLAVRPSRRRRR
jgi:hypothetical protein